MDSGFAFLEKRADAFTGLISVQRFDEERSLHLEVLAVVVGLRCIRQALDPPDGASCTIGQFCSPSQSFGCRASRGYAAIHDTRAMEPGSADRGARHQEFAGQLHGERARQEIRTVTVRVEADLYVRHRELRVVGRDDEVAAQRY